MKPSGNSGEVSSQLEGAINQHVVDRWEFYALNDVNIEVQPGCLGRLVGGRTATSSSTSSSSDTTCKSSQTARR
jgi:hypothetical protein